MPLRRTAPHALAACAVVTLAACGGGDPAPSAQPTRTARALADAIAPQATSAVDATALFDWAEYTYPALFAKGPQNQPLRFEGVDYTIRGYANGNYLGLTAGGEVYGLGPFTNQVLTSFGMASDYAAQVAADACKVDPASCSSALPLAAGYDITLARRADGSVVSGASGLPWDRTPTTELAGSHFRVVAGLQASSIDLGRLYALAVGTDGQLHGWGVNSGGLLGGSEGNGNVPAPRAMAGLSGVQQALATQTYALALRDDGSVWHWPGVLTTSTRGAVSTPRVVDGLAGVVSLTALETSVDGARQRPAAILSDGSVRELAWTARVSFTTDTTLQTHTGTAAVVPGLSDIRRIACKLSHCLAITRAGAVLEWNGQIGRSGLAVPTAVPGLTGVVGIAALADASVALTRDGRVFSWGGSQWNGHGGGADLPVPTALSLPAAATAVAAGWQHVSIRLADGSLWGWGANQGGQLGDGTTQDRRTPVKATGVVLN
ncbi:hypothetical protein [Ideonella sp. A 288]|uniref:RCC1 domain-containing protein n=1 Tax=Ideonella sp. A 288 TaxID=1962181 RepID=UPI000B4A9592|nr:hypothetical protein [Ideonella sp. A 288]